LREESEEFNCNIFYNHKEIKTTKL
jgi:hypothetical protein